MPEGYRRLGLVAGIVAGAVTFTISISILELLTYSGSDLWGLFGDLALWIGSVSLFFACRRSLFPARAYPLVALLTEILIAADLGSGLMGWQYRGGEAVVRTGLAGGSPPFDIGAGEVPWTGVWILLFAAVVPLRPRQHLIGGLISISTLLAWPALSVAIQGLPAAVGPHGKELTVGITVWLFVRALLAAALSYFAARSVYGLRRQLAEARRIGSYQLREKLGEGGMGEVWRADHQMLARSAAIKLIKPSAEDGRSPAAGTLQRFEREVQAAAQLRSPHTIEIYDYGVTADGAFYYVMELLDGIDLEQLVRRYGPLPWRRVVHILVQACHSLAEAHERGLIHRDIKPANLSLCRLGRDVDEVKVLDFGLVKATAKSPDPDVTQEGTFIGTPAYAAPELATGPSSQADHRADLYSLGCVAFWLLTGNRVFEGQSPVALLVRHAHEAPPAPSSRTELPIPAELDRIVLDCLAKHPSARPASADELSARLAAVAGSNPWSRQEAQAWWDLHRPSASDAKPEASNAQPTVEWA